MHVTNSHLTRETSLASLQPRLAHPASEVAMYPAVDCYFCVLQPLNLCTLDSATAGNGMEALRLASTLVEENFEV